MSSIGSVIANQTRALNNGDFKNGIFQKLKTSVERMIASRNSTKTHSGCRWEIKFSKNSSRKVSRREDAKMPWTNRTICQDPGPVPTRPNVQKPVGYESGERGGLRNGGRVESGVNNNCVS